jgi:thiamine biosynthesis protein ThiS
MTNDPPAATVAVSVNGVARDVAAGSTAAELVVALGCAGRPVAVEVNEQVVPRADLARRQLAAGDRLEIVTLVGGG